MEGSAGTQRWADSMNFPFFMFFPKGPTALKTDSKLACSFPGSNESISPTRTCMIPALRSILNGTLFTAATIACSISLVRVPFLIVGISPRGPRNRATLVRTGIICGVAMHRLNLILPVIISEISSAPPAICAPAFNALSTTSGGAMTRTRASVLIEAGRLIIPRIPLALSNIR